MLVLRLQDAAMSPAELEMHCCDADTVCSMCKCMFPKLKQIQSDRFRLHASKCFASISTTARGLAADFSYVCDRWMIWWQHCGRGDVIRRVTSSSFAAMDASVFES